MNNALAPSTRSPVCGSTSPTSKISTSNSSMGDPLSISMRLSAVGATASLKENQSTSLTLSIESPLNVISPLESGVPSKAALPPPIVGSGAIRLNACEGMSFRPLSPLTPEEFSALSTKIGLPLRITTVSSPSPASTQTVFCTVGPIVISSLPASASTKITKKSPSGGNKLFTSCV